MEGFYLYDLIFLSKIATIFKVSISGYDYRSWPLTVKNIAPGMFIVIIKYSLRWLLIIALHLRFLEFTFPSFLIKGFTPPKPPTCVAPLGMQNNQISDSALRASTSYNVNSMGPRNGRLHFQAKSGQYGAWATSTNNEFQYFEVSFGDWTQVTQVATQGRQDGAWWVKSYILASSDDGVFFRDYQEDNKVKVPYLHRKKRIFLIRGAHVKHEVNSIPPP